MKRKFKDDDKKYTNHLKQYRDKIACLEERLKFQKRLIWIWISLGLILYHDILIVISLIQ